ncbi:ankyrin repeat-containing At5g02620-like [Olea europaea subsp. europaea]|uniref:Ankyrin repeat-containing At5g02620-like n=1 Tax=Olea europaea subsp. europaea TaxID=158383 RepID=A0A8S0T162_OLEEU|nr:ankyrin repeat-containing At5g02620-like [Olea europaea subsp. europaea]
MRGGEKLKTYKSKPRLGRDDESELSREVSHPPMDTHKNRSNPLVTERQVQQLQNMNNQTEIEIDSHVSNSNNAQHPIVHQETATEEVVTLRRAALRGDWKPIETALSSGKKIASTKITERGYSILHIAATAKQTSLVHKLVKNLDKSDLELLNNERNTAFCFATMLGVIEIAKVIISCEVVELYAFLTHLRIVSPETATEEVVTLCRAALRGDWKPIETALSSGKIIASTKITERGYTILHIAATAKQTSLVHKLVKNFDKSDLELLNNERNTAFCFATVLGVIEIVKVMYEKNNNLPTIRSSWVEKTPLEMAILLRKRKMVEYLYPITPRKDLKPEEIRDIFLTTIQADIFQKDILTSNEIQASELGNRPWEQITKLPYSDRVKLVKKPKIFHDAAKIGNVEFLTLLTHSYPDLIWKVNKKKHSIFHVAVINRQEKVFRLIYQTGADKDLITFLTDDNENNILHLAGEMEPPSRLNIVSRAALQMQRELLWFKEVEKIVSNPLLDMKNNDGKTPRELFSQKHKELRQDGEKWMKDTASSCMVVATLIATVAFAAAFTVPGGNNEIGTPVFLKNKRFTVFVISNAVAMFSSTTSIMMFLSILTSRYTEDDFLFSLPAKLMVGLISRFASIVCVVLTFSATFFLVYNEEKHGLLSRLVVALAWLPITIYAVLNHRLGIALIHSTCWPAVLMFRRGKHKLY